MTMTTIPGIHYKIEDDNITLEQDHVDGAVYIQLHKIHIQHIAGELGSAALSITGETIKRRFGMVTARLYNLAATNNYRTEIINSSTEGLALFTELDLICDIATEFLADINSTLNKQRTSL